MAQWVCGPSPSLECAIGTSISGNQRSPHISLPTCGVRAVTVRRQKSAALPTTTGRRIIQKQHCIPEGIWTLVAIKGLKGVILVIPRTAQFGTSIWSAQKVDRSWRIYYHTHKPVMVPISAALVDSLFPLASKHSPGTCYAATDLESACISLSTCRFSRNSPLSFWGGCPGDHSGPCAF